MNRTYLLSVLGVKVEMFLFPVQLQTVGKTILIKLHLITSKYKLTFQLVPDE